MVRVFFGGKGLEELGITYVMGSAPARGDKVEILGWEDGDGNTYDVHGQVIFRVWNLDGDQDAGACFVELNQVKIEEK